MKRSLAVLLMFSLVSCCPHSTIPTVEENLPEVIDKLINCDDNGCSLAFWQLEELFQSRNGAADAAKIHDSKRVVLTGKGPGLIMWGVTDLVLGIRIAGDKSIRKLSVPGIAYPKTSEDKKYVDAVAHYASEFNRVSISGLRISGAKDPGEFCEANYPGAQMAATMEGRSVKGGVADILTGFVCSTISLNGKCPDNMTSYDEGRYCKSKRLPIFRTLQEERIKNRSYLQARMGTEPLLQPSLIIFKTLFLGVVSRRIFFKKISPSF